MLAKRNSCTHTKSVQRYKKFLTYANETNKISFSVFFFVCYIRIFLLTLSLSPCLIIIQFLSYSYSVFVLFLPSFCLILTQFLSYSYSVFTPQPLFSFQFLLPHPLAPYMFQYIPDTYPIHTRYIPDTYEYPMNTL